MRHTLTIRLQNEAGALLRVAGLFAARGVNIDALEVHATEEPDISLLTLKVQGDSARVEQILKQTRKLVDVLVAE